MVENNNLNPGDGDSLGNSDNKPTSIVNADGSFAENWHEKFGEENKAHLSRYNDFDALVNSHIATKKKFGRDPDSLIQVPKADSSDEVKAAFHKAAGELETVKDYKFVKSPDISAKVEIIDAQLKRWAGIAKKYHLNNEQYNGAANDYLIGIGEDVDAFDTQQAEDTEKANQEGNAVLTKIFREDSASRKVRANAVLDKYGLETIKMPDGTETTIKGMLFEENPKLLQSPWMIMLLDRFAESMSEDTLKGLTATVGVTENKIKSELAEIYTEMEGIMKEHPINFKINSRYKDLVERKHELNRQRRKKMPA